jgi:NADPH2:quinone reductase
MRVVQATKFGGPEVLVPSEAAEPVAGPSQVVVEVSVAPVLFLDTQIRSGSARVWFPATPPYVPGRGVAGAVSSVGRVWTLTGWAAGSSLIPPTAVTWSGPWSR